MVQPTKITECYYVPSDASVFDPKITINVKDDQFALYYEYAGWTSIDTNVTLTIDEGFQYQALIASQFFEAEERSDDFYLISNNSAKNFKINVTSDIHYGTALATCISCAGYLYLGNDQRDTFRANITTNVTNNEGGSASAIGIESQVIVETGILAGTINANAVSKYEEASSIAMIGQQIDIAAINKAVTVTATGEIDSYAIGFQTGMESMGSITIGDITGAINVTATTKTTDMEAFYYEAGFANAGAFISSGYLYINDIQAAITVKSTGLGAVAEALYASQGINVDDIEKALTATASSTSGYGESDAAVIHSTNIEIEDINAALKATASNGNWADASVLNAIFEDEYAQYFEAGSISIESINKDLTASATTAKGDDAEAYGIVGGNITIEEKIAGAISATATANVSKNSDSEAYAKAICGGEVLEVYGDITKSITATAKASWEAEAVGIVAQNISIYNKIDADIKATASAANASACAIDGVYASEDNYDYGDDVDGGYIYDGSTSINIDCISKNITATASGSEEAMAEGIFAETGSIDIDHISGAVSATATANTAKDAFSIAKAVAIGGAYVDICEISKSITATAKAASEAEAEGISGYDVMIGNLDATITVNASADDAEAEGIYGFTVNIDEISKSITATAKAAGEAEVEGISGYYVTLGDINGAVTVNASADDAEAFAVDSEAYIRIDKITKNITATANGSDTGMARGLDATNSIYLQECSGNISVTAKGDVTTAYAICSQGSVDLGNISGNITASAKNGDAAAIVSFRDPENVGPGYGDPMDPGYMNPGYMNPGYMNPGYMNPGYMNPGYMNPDDYIEPMEGNGIRLNGDITGKINVTADTVAYGIYTNGSLYLSDNVITNITCNGKVAAYGIDADTIKVDDYETAELEANISVTATGRDAMDATGISFNKFMGEELIFSGSITAKGEYMAFGIHGGDYAPEAEPMGDGLDYLILYNAKIEAKTSSKYGMAYAIALEETIVNYVYLANKSTVTGDINLGGGNDYVSIESGSKLVGGVENTEWVVLDIYTVDGKNNALWQNIDDSGITDLGIQFNRGMTGEFALCTRKSKDTDWMEILDESEDGIALELNDREFVDYLYLGSAVDDGLYKYELVEKGNTLSLAVSVL